jgi:hypothetical protein
MRHGAHALPSRDRTISIHDPPKYLLHKLLRDH